VGKAVQTVYVQRESGSAKAKAFEAIKERALAQGWRHLLLFPEGTTTNRKALIKFKRGAFTPGTPVQPILFRSPFNHFDPAWTSGGPNRAVQIIRLLMQWQVQFEIEVSKKQKTTRWLSDSLTV
jgi:lysophosphatidylcholine acyltransferase/lyso-PAF acetyltransferase